MKKLSLLVIVLISSLSAWAQTGNVILFTENGEKFTAVLNGIRQNEATATNVKITGLNAEFYKLKVIFDNPALGERNFNLGLQLNEETSYAIKKNTKGEYVIRLVSAVNMAEAPPAKPTQTTVVYSQNPAATSVTHQTTQTTTTTGSPDNINMNIGISAGEDHAGISMNVDNGVTSTVQTTTTTTTTSTTVTSGTSAANNQQQENVAPPVYLAGYTGAIGCPMPMTPAEFSALKQTLASKSFEDTKLSIAKQAIAQHCFLVSQVKQIIDLFSFEDSKLDLAKHCYRHTYDIGNYFQVNDAFTFDSTADELTKYIESVH